MGGGGSGQRQAQVSLPRGKTRYPFYRRLGGLQGRSGWVRKNSPPWGFDPRRIQAVAIPTELSRIPHDAQFSDSAPKHLQLLVLVKMDSAFYCHKSKAGRAVPLHVWSGPEGSMKLRFPDFTTKAQDGGKVVSLTHQPPLPPGNTPGTYFS